MEDQKDNHKRSLLLGVGLDTDDGHVRITSGKNFYLVGGSEGTHSSMQEKTIKFNEELDRRVKTLDEISMREFLEIAVRARMISEQDADALESRE